MILVVVPFALSQSKLKLSRWFTAQDVNTLLSTISGLDSAVDWCKGLGVTKVYLEAYGRGDYAARCLRFPKTAVVRHLYRTTAI
jgi:hypothetical protein